jgi:hypothetical protein
VCPYALPNISPVSAQQRLLINQNPPRIVIWSTLDVLSGANASQTIYRVNYPPQGTYSEWEDSLDITSYVEPESVCTLARKCVVSGAQVYTLIKYAALRLFLWFLITGEWDYSILLQRNTVKFFRALSESQYAIYIRLFEGDELRGYGKYFVR